MSRHLYFDVPRRLRIGVAMSGGIDSTAAAWLLKQNGNDVIGLHMRLHAEGGASWERVQQVAAEIGVRVTLVDLRKEFRTEVVAPFVLAYAEGRTPSPCPMCNRFIKMTRLWDVAHGLGCERLATGHYARIARPADGPALLRGVDKRKDQSYFLSMLTRDMLERVMFPLGESTKATIRQMLQDEGISASTTGESQELCFVPANDYRAFLMANGIEPRPGPIVDVSGHRLGQHRGIVGYTVGQRRGLGVSAGRPLYVVRIDPSTDTLVVGPREATLVSRTRVTEMNWLTASIPPSFTRFQVKVRSTSRPVWCTLTEVDGWKVELLYDEPVSGVAPGQAAVLYAGERVIGGGWIVESDGADCL
ncbi:MAG: tRNA 2-thiouridine(34) synthase MnmA [Desulfomonile sp.]|nr:tRNA 2-thiouridine(34) synthase MnmA [Desulfomonile sp.]